VTGDILADSQVDPFLSVAEMTAILRVSNMAIYRLITSGELAAIRVSSSYRVRTSVFTAWLNGCVVHAPAAAGPSGPGGC
jgi:excisionase family DNA binding protein